MSKKSIAISEELHTKLQELSASSGMPINQLLEIAGNAGFDAAVAAAEAYKKIVGGAQ